MEKKDDNDLRGQPQEGAGSDSNFEVDLGESLHLQSDARTAFCRLIAVASLQSAPQIQLDCSYSAQATLRQKEFHAVTTLAAGLNCKAVSEPVSAPPVRARRGQSSLDCTKSSKLVQGQRLVPLQAAHKLEARALIEAVGPKRLHLFMGYCAATSPAARSTPLRSARA